VDERIYPELQQMFDDARAQGIYPLINESYRTAERQQQIMDNYIASYEAGGMSHDDAVKKARTIVALPGTSEHQLGLALDIIAEYDADSTATWNWLRDNCWRYGFILRYPAGKEEITGISYEPWHFRYVGVPAAQEITEAGLCLEEYLGG
jgi:D-alanyl-D-alanine carboxypeptidase